MRWERGDGGRVRRRVSGRWRVLGFEGESGREREGEGG